MADLDDGDAPPRAIRGERCVYIDAGPGQLIVRLDSFAHFGAFIRSLPPDLRSQYVWRGQARAKWPLESSFERLRKQSGLDSYPDLLAEHLERFQRAARGRVTTTPLPAGDNEWWAYAQHHGLKTPLLDWTVSPFTAAFFAFAEPVPPPNSWRCVYGLCQPWVESTSKRLRDLNRAFVEFVDPFLHSSARLLSQDGVFTKLPDGVALQDYVREHSDKTDKKVYLLRIDLPESERGPALSYLREMRVSYQSLFPDIEGAALDANLRYDLQGDISTFAAHEEIAFLNEAKGSLLSSQSLSEVPQALRVTTRRSNPRVGPGRPSTITDTVRHEDGRPASGVQIDRTVRIERIENPFAPY